MAHSFLYVAVLLLGWWDSFAKSSKDSVRFSGSPMRNPSPGLKISRCQPNLSHRGGLLHSGQTSGASYPQQNTSNLALRLHHSQQDGQASLDPDINRPKLLIHKQIHQTTIITGNNAWNLQHHAISETHRRRTPLVVSIKADLDRYLPR